MNLSAKCTGCLLVALAGCSSSGPGAAGPGPNLVFPDGSVAPTATCESEGGGAAVAKPVRVLTLTGDKSWAETGWFLSPGLVDLDGDGKNDVVGIPNAEMKEPYETQGYAFLVLQGAYGDGSASAMRLPGWETLPMSGKPAVRGDGDWYPPDGVPALDGAGNLEIVLLTFDHGVDMHTVPGSGNKCLPWPTGRGNLLRNGQGPAYAR